MSKPLPFPQVTEFTDIKKAKHQSIITYFSCQHAEHASDHLQNSRIKRRQRTRAVDGVQNPHVSLSIVAVLRRPHPYEALHKHDRNPDRLKGQIQEYMRQILFKTMPNSTPV